MKALTIKPPWSGLIIFGGKDIENRSWQTKLRGRIAIHASNKRDLHEMDAGLEVFTRIQGRPLMGPTEHRLWSDLICQAGVILGTVEIVGCVQQSDSPWFSGPWGFVLANPRPLKKPIPCLGHLSFWDLPREIEERLTL